MKQLFRMAMLAAIVGVVVMLANVNPKSVTTAKRDLSARNWIKARLPGTDAHILGFSEERELWDHSFLVGWVRGKNAHGVMVVTYYVFEMGSGQEVRNAWTAREFIALKELELRNAPSDQQGQRAGELQRFCDEMGIPIELA